MKSLHLTRPYAIMTVGIPGSGKSYFATSFSETFGVPYVDFDQIDDRSGDAAKAGELALMFLTELAKTKQSFVFEGSSASRLHRTEFGRLARSLGYTPLFIWVQTDQITAGRRIAKTGQYTKEAFVAALNDFSPPHPTEKPVVISGKHTFASQAKVVLTYLSGENRSSQISVNAPTRASADSDRSAQPASASSRHTISVR